MFWDWFVSYRHLVSAAHFPTYMFSSIKPLHKSQVNSRLLNDIWKIEPTLLLVICMAVLVDLYCMFEKLQIKFQQAAKAQRQAPHGKAN